MSNWSGSSYPFYSYYSSYSSVGSREDRAEMEWAKLVEEKTGKKTVASVVYVSKSAHKTSSFACPKVDEIVEREKLDKIVVLVPLSLKLLLQKWYQYSHDEVAITFKPKFEVINGVRYMIIEEWDLPDEQRTSPAFVEITKDTKMWEGGAHLHPPGVTSFSGTDERSILQQYKWNLLFLSPTGKVVKIAYKTELPCGEPIVIVTEPLDEMIIVRKNLEMELEEFKGKWEKLLATAKKRYTAARWVTQTSATQEKKEAVPQKEEKEEELKTSENSSENLDTKSIMKEDTEEEEPSIANELQKRDYGGLLNSKEEDSDDPIARYIR